MVVTCHPADSAQSHSVARSAQDVRDVARPCLERLAALPRTRRIYIHINNTNPILDEESMEHRMVRDAGWEVAWDGMEITL